MKTIRLAWNYIKQNRATSLLGILLAAFGSAILCLLLLTSDQLATQLDRNSRGIDLVVGAKGSPTQLILSSIYHVDNPTGNIRLHEARALAANPMVNLAVPLALGDNYRGHRIIGTDSTFMELYGLRLAAGQLWEGDFEAVIGASVASQRGLQIGDTFTGAHGLSAGGHEHDEHPYTVTGILEQTGRLTDGLILTSVRSVWEVHGIHETTTAESLEDTEEIGSQQDPGAVDNLETGLVADADTATATITEAEDEEEVVYVRSMMPSLQSNEETNLEITAMLIQYRTPNAVAVLPRMINQSTNMQAASPAIESARLFSLLGVGIDSLQVLAYIIMIMAAFSVFISLYSSFRRRKYDLAVMRTLGASRSRLFSMVIAEGMMITLAGTVLGLVIGHIAMYLISMEAGQAGSLFKALKIVPGEGWLIVLGLLIGFLAAVIPAIRAYYTPISQTLAEKNN